MSFSVRALRTASCCPKRAAAACATLVSGCAFELLGLTRKAIMLAVGTSARNSSSRFATSREVNRLTPVTLLPGRLRLATIAPCYEDDRNRGGRRLGRECRRVTTCCENHGWLTASQIGRQRGQPIVLTLGPAKCDVHILPLDVAGLGQTLAERSHGRCRLVGR